jgi:FkbM family methyltransferase
MNHSETEISVSELSKFWIKTGVSVVHCGAHLGEEAEEYNATGWSEVIWIEANQFLIPKLVEATEKYDGNQVVCSALWSESGLPIELKIANNSYSSSLLNFGTHSLTYPEVFFVSEAKLVSTKLDDLLERHPVNKGGILVLDLQGSEMQVLQGAKESLSDFRWVYTEVSKVELYSGQGTWNRISSYLEDYGFQLVDWQYSKELNWGNALYLRTSNPFVKFCRIRRCIERRICRNT